MKAIVISPASQSIETVDIASLDDVRTVVGYDTLESDAIGTQGDRLYFDEECSCAGPADEAGSQRLPDALAGAGLTWRGEPVWARYDAPWTPWLLRRNEIWLEFD